MIQASRNTIRRQMGTERGIRNRQPMNLAALAVLTPLKLKLLVSLLRLCNLPNHMSPLLLRARQVVPSQDLLRVEEDLHLLGIG